MLNTTVGGVGTVKFGRVAEQKQFRYICEIKEIILLIRIILVFFFCEDEQHPDLITYKKENPTSLPSCGLLKKLQVKRRETFVTVHSRVALEW